MSSASRPPIGSTASFPVRAGDLPGYAVALYDEYLERPELVRLATWARLERTPVGDLLAHVAPLTAVRLEAIERAQADGHVDPSMDPADVFALVTAVSMTWSPASVVLAASRDEDESAHEHRRLLLADAVRRMVGTTGAVSAATTLVATVGLPDEDLQLDVVRSATGKRRVAAMRSRVTPKSTRVGPGSGRRRRRVQSAEHLCGLADRVAGHDAQAQATPTVVRTTASCERVAGAACG